MVNGHTATGIAQAVFYAPVTIYAQYIGIRCWNYASKAACYMIMTFTIIRLAGGVLLVEVQQDKNADNVSMIKATYIFLNVGVVPLVTAFDGLLNRMRYGLDIKY
ncbi:hypothetical protein GRF29_44g47522 [Pseudopithomyces chartarum]|uniref:DUF7702 domain-containing protein n=1 Tax=Pseudopithomyces chartarum TaxID=1892770 RepID=A0AAN6RJJ2_9PLEO|nr:hypothetical protein GRF29_44g47522 [Pseudopithomyces chartarum]